MDKGTKVKPYIAGVVFSVMVGFSFLSIKVCVPIASTIEILTFRYNFAFICATSLIFLKAAKMPRFNGENISGVFFSALFYVLFMAFQAVGLIFSSSIESAILFAIIPILTKIIAEVFLKEKSSRRQNVFVYMSVTALIFMIAMSAGDIAVNFFGIMILLISSLCIAISNVFIRSARNKYSPFSIMYLVTAFGFIFFNLGYLISLLYSHKSIMTYFAPCAHYELILGAAYLGIPCIVASTWLMSYMLANLEAVKATIFGNLSTAISIAAGIIVLGESLTFYNIIGIIIIVAGVIGVSATGVRE